MPQLARGISNAAELLRKLNALNNTGIKGVLKWRHSFSEDWSGDPAIFFWVTLTDEASGKESLPAVTSAFRKLFTDRIDFRNDWDLIPYFTFRSQSEQDRLKSEEYE
jgi:hypothetical protein